MISRKYDLSKERAIRYALIEALLLANGALTGTQLAAILDVSGQVGTKYLREYRAFNPRYLVVSNKVGTYPLEPFTTKVLLDPTTPELFLTGYASLANVKPELIGE